MKRLTRDEKQAETRAKLLGAAHGLFVAEGYLGVSVDRIAEEAGYSKGAVYSNFTGKEQIFLEVLETYGHSSLERLLAAIDAAGGAEQVIGVIADWATAASRGGNWALLVLEYARHAKPAPVLLGRLEEILRDHWRALGGKLAERLGIADVEADALGALVFELTYAPAVSFVEAPSAGDLVRLALGGLNKKGD